MCNCTRLGVSRFKWAVLYLLVATQYWFAPYLLQMLSHLWAKYLAIYLTGHVAGEGSDLKVESRWPVCRKLAHGNRVYGRLNQLAAPAESASISRLYRQL